MTTDDPRVETLAAKLAASDGLDWDEVCGHEADRVDCGSGTCIAAHYEDHDPDLARSHYRKWARIALEDCSALTARVKALEGALREVMGIPAWEVEWKARSSVVNKSRTSPASPSPPIPPASRSRT